MPIELTLEELKELGVTATAPTTKEGVIAFTGLTTTPLIFEKYGSQDFQAGYLFGYGVIKEGEPPKFIINVQTTTEKENFPSTITWYFSLANPNDFIETLNEKIRARKEAADIAGSGPGVEGKEVKTEDKPKPDEFTSHLTTLGAVVTTPNPSEWLVQFDEKTAITLKKCETEIKKTDDIPSGKVLVVFDPKGTKDSLFYSDDPSAFESYFARGDCQFFYVDPTKSRISLTLFMEEYQKYKIAVHKMIPIETKWVTKETKVDARDDLLEMVKTAKETKDETFFKRCMMRLTKMAEEFDRGDNPAESFKTYEAVLVLDPRVSVPEWWRCTSFARHLEQCGFEVSSHAEASSSSSDSGLGTKLNVCCPDGSKLTFQNIKNKPVWPDDTILYDYATKTLHLFSTVDHTIPTIYWFERTSSDGDVRLFYEVYSNSPFIKKPKLEARINELQKDIISKPNDPSFRIHLAEKMEELGKIYHALGRRTEAFKMIEDAYDCYNDALVKIGEFTTKASTSDMITSDTIDTFNKIWAEKISNATTRLLALGAALDIDLKTRESKKLSVETPKKLPEEKSAPKDLFIAQLKDLGFKAMVRLADENIQVTFPIQKPAESPKSSPAKASSSPSASMSSTPAKALGSPAKTSTSSSVKALSVSASGTSSSSSKGASSDGEEKVLCLTLVTSSSIEEFKSDFFLVYDPSAKTVAMVATVDDYNRHKKNAAVLLFQFVSFESDKLGTPAEFVSTYEKHADEVRKEVGDQSSIPVARDLKQIKAFMKLGVSVSIVINKCIALQKEVHSYLVRYSKESTTTNMFFLKCYVTYMTDVGNRFADLGDYKKAHEVYIVCYQYSFPQNREHIKHKCEASFKAGCLSGKFELPPILVGTGSGTSTGKEGKEERKDEPKKEQPKTGVVGSASGPSGSASSHSAASSPIGAMTPAATAALTGRAKVAGVGDSRASAATTTAAGSTTVAPSTSSTAPTPVPASTATAPGRAAGTLSRDTSSSASDSSSSSAPATASGSPYQSPADIHFFGLFPS